MFSELLQDGMEEGETEESVSNCVNVDVSQRCQPVRLPSVDTILHQTVRFSFFGPPDPLAQALEGNGPVTEFDYHVGLLLRRCYRDSVCSLHSPHYLDYLKLAFCSEPLPQYEEKDSLANDVDVCNKSSGPVDDDDAPPAYCLSPNTAQWLKEFAEAFPQPTYDYQKCSDEMQQVCTDATAR